MQLSGLKAQVTRYLPLAIILTGLGAVGLSVAVDYIGISDDPGFGPQQVKLAVAGVLIVLLGILVLPPVKHGFLFRWVMPAVEYKYPTSAVPLRMGQILLLAVWFGLLLGLSDLGYYLDQWQTYHREERLALNAVNVVWMAPLGGILITGTVAVVLGLLSWRWPRLASAGSTVTVFAFLGFLSLTFIFYPGLHFAAIPVLALGLAVVAGRFINAHPHRFYGFVRRTAFPLLVVVGALTVGVLVWDVWRERQALADLPPAAPGAPNVLFITLDTVRARSLSLYGYPRPTTPNLERFAGRSVTFDWPISPSPWTLPSHSSMFTGRWPHELSADFYSALDDTYPTLAEELYSYGYETAGFAANPFYGHRVYGLNRGMVHYEDIKVTVWEVFRSSSIVSTLFERGEVKDEFKNLALLSRKDAAHLSGDFLRWLDRRSEPDRPFFAFLNYYDAHDPYVPPPRLALQFASKERPKSTWKWDERVPREDVEELNDAYDAALAYLDEQLALLFAELQERGLLENTLVVITSDHGEHFGEHELMGHGNSLYLPLTHVPLIISIPGRVPSNVRVAQPVTLRDLPDTVLDVLDLEGAADFPGKSLARYWNGDSSSETAYNEILLSEVSKRSWIPDWFPAQKGDMKSLVADYNLYINIYTDDGDDIEELYHILRDPLEENNLALAGDSRPALEDFRDVLKDLPASASYRAATPGAVRVAAYRDE